MIDARAARANADDYRSRLARKGAADAFDAWLAADERWRTVVPQVDELRSRTKLKGRPTPEQLEELKGVKEQLQAAEQELASAEQERDRLALRIPNPPADDVPDGSTEDDVEELRRVGEPPQLAEAKEHVEIGRFDMERAARMSGARFGFWIGDTARLAFALYAYAIDRLVEKGFAFVLPPVLVREEALYGTGAFPTDTVNVYKVEEDPLYLAGTAEIPLASLHGGEILDPAELPLRYVAFSPCFRREAGSYGKDTRGIIRVHQFDKIEMFSFCRPEDAKAEHRRLLEWEKQFLASLELPFRVIDVATGDLGLSAARKFDCEAWIPTQGKYRELTSTSNCTQFQARRLGIRYRAGDGPAPVATLNGTLCAMGRTIVALLEVHQQQDGSVRVPKALQAHLGREVLEPPR
jgi:seryl-tRNA synthetase